MAEFAPDASKPSGHSSICRPCDRLKSREYYAANREKKLAAVKAYQARRSAEDDPR